MTADAWITAAIVIAAFGALWSTRVAPDLVFGGALLALLLTRVLDVEQAFRGFANPSVITVGLLYVIVAGLRETGVVYWIGRRLFGKARSEREMLLRLSAPAMGISALLNNTPVVAMLLPAIRHGSRAKGVSASKLLLPLSYATILGGSITLIGTSTNLVVDGLMRELGLRGLGIFELAWVGLPTAMLGLAFLVFAAPRLIPERTPVEKIVANSREYLVEMTVDPSGSLAGRSIDSAGLRHLPGLFLIEINRAGRVISPVGPDELLHAGDQLVFTGAVESVVDLQRINGLLPAKNQIFKLDGQRHRRTLIEAVVSGTAPIVGRTLRESGFRGKYDSVVIAAARAGRRVKGKLGDMRIQAGDTLLLELHPATLERLKRVHDFYLVSPVANSAPPRFDRALLATTILVGMVVAAAVGWLTMLEAALLAAGALLVTRALRPETARTAIEWPVVLAIGASISLGTAMQSSGLAEVIASPLANLSSYSIHVALLSLYLLTALVTAVITNNAAAVLTFPIAMELAAGLGASPMPFAVTVMMAASASFATPIGYQTNLMVYGPGGYHFSDFVRMGIPMTALTAAIAVPIIPLVWPP